MVGFTRLWTADNERAADASNKRKASYYRDAPKEIQGTLDACTNCELREGDLVDLDHFAILDFEGQPELTRALVIQRTDRDGRIDVRIRTTKFGRRFAFIAPDTAPDYDDASFSDLEYGYISPDSGDFPDGGAPYLIF